MSKRIDLTGQKFGRLTVVEYSHTKDGVAYWRCLCDCGNASIVRGPSLREGNTQSCGCLQKEKRFQFKHGQSYTRIYRIWQGMIHRCYDKNSINFRNYGGRGITVCDEWKNNFQAFHDWAMANGYCEDLSIDRIDVNGTYCPENCRWATTEEQSNNRTNNHLLTYNDRTMTIKEWSKETGLSYHCIARRINRLGWDAERTLTTPEKFHKKEK